MLAEVGPAQARPGNHARARKAAARMPADGTADEWPENFLI
jgi:hypothetical protein